MHFIHFFPLFSLFLFFSFLSFFLVLEFMFQVDGEDNEMKASMETTPPPRAAIQSKCWIITNYMFTYQASQFKNKGKKENVYINRFKSSIYIYIYIYKNDVQIEMLNRLAKLQSSWQRSNGSNSQRVFWINNRLDRWGMRANQCWNSTVRVIECSKERWIQRANDERQRANKQKDRDCFCVSRLC